MINLIPESAKRRIRREYLARVFSVWAFLLSLAFCASTALLVPSYVLYARQIHAVTTISESLKKKSESFKSINTTLKEANVFASQLSATSTNAVHAAEVLSHLEASRPLNVSLAGLSVVVDEKKGPTIVARGTAKTREDLRTFIEALKRDAFFDNAQVPVSDLAKDAELDFTVTLTLRKNA